MSRSGTCASSSPITSGRATSRPSCSLIAAHCERRPGFHVESPAADQGHRQLHRLRADDGVSASRERPRRSRRSASVDVSSARNRMSRLKDLTEFLIKIPGRRKAMLLISEAIGFDATDFKDYHGTTMKPAAEVAHAAMTAATRGNIAIYPIHPAGCGFDLTATAPPEARAARSHDGAADGRRRDWWIRAREFQQVRRQLHAPRARSRASTTCSASTQRRRRTTAATCR